MSHKIKKQIPEKVVRLTHHIVKKIRSFLAWYLETEPDSTMWGCQAPSDEGALKEQCKMRYLQLILK